MSTQRRAGQRDYQENIGGMAGSENPIVDPLKRLHQILPA